MSIYDDKTKGINETNGRFILPVFKHCDEAIFKASYIVASDVKCDGKITALFDLTIIGNLEAAELDVKGRFICTGRCEVSGTISVQYDIWAEDIRADNIEAHDRILAQELDISTISADGNIVVGKILAVEKLAQSAKNIICGETAYGSGKISANTVITGEPIDLDEGEESLVAPHLYAPIATSSASTTAVIETTVLKTISHNPKGNLGNYLDSLVKAAVCEEDESKFKRWKVIISEVEKLNRIGFDDYKNIGLLIWVLEIANSEYFMDWPVTKTLLEVLNRHFIKLVQKEKSSIIFRIDSYNEWLKALELLHRYGETLDNAVYDVAFELIVSSLGLKAKFVNERLNEKGWKACG
jgi:hypothetical protein